MSELSEQYQQICSKEFKQINEKLDRIDVVLRGSADGKTPGLGTRIDRLERCKANQTKALWIIVAAAVYGAFNFIKELFKRLL